MEPTYENTEYVRDDDDLQFLGEDGFKSSYQEGIRFICILKWGDCFVIQNNGFLNLSDPVPCPRHLLDQMWEDYKS